MRRRNIFALFLVSLVVVATVGFFITTNKRQVLPAKSFQIGASNGPEYIIVNLNTTYTQLINLLNLSGSWTVSGSKVSTVSYSVSISITANNVQDSYTEVVELKAVRNDDASKYWIWLDSSKTKTGLSDGSASSSYTGDTTPTNLLETELGASESGSYTVDFYIYCKITATGSITGKQLIAEQTWTKFGSITFSWQTDISYTKFVTKSIDFGTESGGSITSTEVEDGATYNIAAEHYVNTLLGVDEYRIGVNFWTNPISGTLQKVYVKFRYSTAPDTSDWIAYKGDGSQTEITSARPTALTKYSLSIDNSYKDADGKLKIKVYAPRSAGTFNLYIDYLAVEYIPSSGSWISDIPTGYISAVIVLMALFGLCTVYYFKKRDKKKERRNGGARKRARKS